MPSGVPKTEMSEKDGEILSKGRVDREFDKLHPVEDRRVGKSLPAGFRLRQDQRAYPVSCGQACWGRSEFVVEDLQRQRAAIAGGQHRSQKPDDIEIALPGKVAEVAAPRQQIASHQRRIGKLDKKELFSRKCRDSGEVVFERQGVKAVQH